MSSPVSRPNTPIPSQPARAVVPRRLLVTASVTIFAVRDWSLWVLLRDGPWGPPMRLVLATETVTDAVDRTLEALLKWPEGATLASMKAGWQEQQVSIWGSAEQGSAVSLIHSVLLRAHRDELRPKLQDHAVPSLRVDWAPVAEIESNQRELDPEVRPVLTTALHTLRSQVQREPEIVLRYLADMGSYHGMEWWLQDDAGERAARETRPMSKLKGPEAGDGTLTLAEATLLYRAFFAADEQIDLSNLRRRLLATNLLEQLDEERPVRGRELDWRRVSRVYRYHPPAAAPSGRLEEGLHAGSSWAPPA
jgi:hypothetical protein